VPLIRWPNVTRHLLHHEPIDDAPSEVAFAISPTVSMTWLEDVVGLDQVDTPVSQCRGSSTCTRALSWAPELAERDLSSSAIFSEPFCAHEPRASSSLRDSYR